MRGSRGLSYFSFCRENQRLVQDTRPQELWGVESEPGIKSVRTIYEYYKSLRLSWPQASEMQNKYWRWLGVTG